MKTETKYKASLKLSAIGDALGWITERVKSSKPFKSKYGSDYITSFHNWKMRRGGQFYGYLDHIKSGSYSDDTQLLLGCYKNETKGSGTSTVLAGLYFACKYAKEPLKGIE